MPTAPWWGSPLAKRRTAQAALAAVALGGTGMAARSARLLWRRRELNWSPPERFVQEAFLSCQSMGAGAQPVLLLHSLEGSADYFGSAFDELADPGPLVVPDLLGFGNSPRSDGGYSPDDHVDALLRMLDILGASQPALIVGHGMGGILALRFASRVPERTRAVVALGAPIYSDPESARRWLGRKASGRDLGRAISRAWPKGHGRIGRSARVAAGTWRPDLPLPVAHQRFESLRADAYWSTLQSCVVEANAVDWFSDITCPVDLVIPAHDDTLDVSLTKEIENAHQNVRVSQLMFGDDRLPLTHPDGCLAAIDRFRDGTLLSRAGAQG